jgi:predicted oxidoreductase
MAQSLLFTRPSRKQSPLFRLPRAVLGPSFIRMQTVQLGSSPLIASRLAYGCWRIGGTWNASEVTADLRSAGRRAVITAFESGYTLFDHADIYCEGEAEQIFGEALKEVAGMRAKVIIATKCGIRKPGDPKPDCPYRYDFSPQYIIESCERSLQRLGVDHIDIYQLHRPDWLMDPEQVASAFVQLQKSGKVREFGVSNFKPSQLTALQRFCPMRLIVNQVEISLANVHAFQDGTLDQCLAEKIIPMAWSPLAGGQLGERVSRVLDSQMGYRIKPTVAALDSIAQQRGVGRSVVALAWLLKHPSRIVPIVGSTKPESIRKAVEAVDFKLSHEDWYTLLAAARGERLP